MLRLGLTCASQEATFASLGVETLRFFLKGQPHHVHRLYELLFNHTIGVAVTRSEAPVEPVLWTREPPAGRLRPRRGAAPLPGPFLPGLPAPDRVFRVPPEVPLRRPRARPRFGRCVAWEPARSSTST